MSVFPFKVPCVSPTLFKTPLSGHTHPEVRVEQKPKKVQNRERQNNEKLLSLAGNLCILNTCILKTHRYRRKITSLMRCQDVCLRQRKERNKITHLPPREKDGFPVAEEVFVQSEEDPAWVVFTVEKCNSAGPIFWGRNARFRVSLAT